MTDEYADIREQVQKLCAQYPGEYWRELDTARAYPTDFVKALTEAGYLSVLIPEEFGGSGLGITAAAAIMEEIQKSGCNGGACHAQMYTMGTVLRHGSDEQKQKYLPGIASGELRMQAFGVTEPTSGTDTLSLRTTAVKNADGDYVINGQKIWTSRVEHSDLMLLLARTQSKDEVEKRFGGMVNAFQYGAPPHGGCAAGIDRIVMLLADEANIREVIMFPMNQRAEDLMMNAPSEPQNEQMRELHLRTIPVED